MLFDGSVVLRSRPSTRRGQRSETFRRSRTVPWRDGGDRELFEGVGGSRLRPRPVRFPSPSVHDQPRRHRGVPVWRGDTGDGRTVPSGQSRVERGKGPVITQSHLVPRGLCRPVPKFPSPRAHRLCNPTVPRSSDRNGRWARSDLGPPQVGPDRVVSSRFRCPAGGPETKSGR